MEGSSPQDSDPSTTNNWIIIQHDAWSRATVSSFYQDLRTSSLSSNQCTRWLLDRASVAVAVSRGAARVNSLFGLHSSLPLLPVARHDEQVLLSVVASQNFDIRASYAMSHAAKRLISLIEGATSASSSAVVAITVLWGYMFASYQGWTLSLKRPAPTPGKFHELGTLLCKQESLLYILEAQDLLDNLARDPARANETEKAGKTFGELLKRINDVLDHAIHLGDQGQAPMCVCGRKGHTPAKCTFKSHI